MQSAQMPSKRDSRVALAISVLLYLACFTQNGICVEGSCSQMPLWAMLVFGVLSFTQLFDIPSAALAWLANPIVFAAWLFLLGSRYRRAFILSNTAMALSLLVYGRVVTAESGMVERVTGYAFGYWIWIGSLAAASIAAYLGDPSFIRSERPII
jgi:hypothetical protein